MIRLTLLLLLITASVIGQNFQGKATYKTFRKVDLKINESQGGNSKMQKQLQEIYPIFHILFL